MWSGAFSPVLLFVTSLFLSSQAVHPSPHATTELLCHTNHASECYPKTFQPRPYFQMVHDDQELPPGLHVRVNLETGVKEAKLNNVKEDDESIYDVAIVPSDISSDVGSEDPSEEDVLPPGYTQAVLQAQQDGSIRPPPSGDDASSFTFNQEILKSASPDTDPSILEPALDVLSDLAHDIYYGLQLSKDRSSVHKLISLLSLNDTNHKIKASAAVVFGAALHNNPAALSAALDHCYNDELPTGPMEAVIMALIHEQMPNFLSRFIYLLSALSQDPAQLLKFIDADGMDLLFNIYDVDGAGHDDRDKLRIKVANFLLDHLLQDQVFPESDNQVHPQKKQGTDAENDAEDEESWVVIPQDSTPLTGWRKDVERLEEWRFVMADDVANLRKRSDEQECLDHAQGLQTVVDAIGRKIDSIRNSNTEL